MSDSGVSTLPDNIATGQAQKEVTANEALQAMSMAAFGGQRALTTAGLTWGYYGGRARKAGVPTLIANGTLTLAASTTNYIEYDPVAGTITSNTSGFSGGRTPLYSVVTGASSITSWIDYRSWGLTEDPYLSKSVAGGSNVTLNGIEDRADVLELTGAISANINVVVGLARREPRIVANLTSGAFTVTIIGASGTGIVVATGKRAILYSDGTNIQRATPDT